MNYELFKQFLKELDEAPDYVKENTMCYFWHNTSACTKCPKTNYKLFCEIIRRIGRGEYKKLFFPKENPPVLDGVELEKFRKSL